MLQLTFFKPKKGARYENFGEAMTAVHDQIMLGKCKKVDRKLLKYLLKHQDLIPENLNQVGQYFIASGAPVKKGKNEGFHALNKNGEGWCETIIYKSDRFADGEKGDKILIFK